MLVAVTAVVKISIRLLFVYSCMLSYSFYNLLASFYPSHSTENFSFWERPICALDGPMQGHKRETTFCIHTFQYYVFGVGHYRHRTEPLWAEHRHNLFAHHYIGLSPHYQRLLRAIVFVLLLVVNLVGHISSSSATSR